jgi:hypothetical protein
MIKTSIFVTLLVAVLA